MHPASLVYLSLYIQMRMGMRCNNNDIGTSREVKKKQQQKKEEEKKGKRKKQQSVVNELDVMNF